MNQSRNINSSKPKTANATKEHFPLIRSLFIDGRKIHIQLRLPIRSQVTGLPGQPEGAPIIDYAPISAMLTTRPAVDGPNNLVSTEGDLVPFTFRLLSAAYLGSGGYHLDFSREGVLKRALSLFLEPDINGSARHNPLVVVRDHSFSIEDRIGVVRNAHWSSTLQSDAGQSSEEDSLPLPGIDAELHINWKLAGDVVRRLLHDPPLLDSCSVSLGFNWEKSHPDLDNNLFWRQLGEEVNGSAVRIIVSEILTVEHVGLVYAGADPTARRTIKPSHDLEKSAITACLSSKSTKKILATGGDAYMEETTVTITADSPILALLGVNEPDLTLIEQRAGDLKRLAELGQDALTELRQEVEDLIVQLDGVAETDPSRGLLKVVHEADMATLKALKTEYQQRLDSMMPLHCQNCGSEQVSRRSSKEAGLADVRQENDDPGRYQ